MFEDKESVDIDEEACLIAQTGVGAVARSGEDARQARQQQQEPPHRGKNDLLLLPPE